MPRIAVIVDDLDNHLPEVARLEWHALVKKIEAM